MVHLITERLIIRDYLNDDSSALHNLLSQKEVMRFLPETYCESKYESKENLRIAIEESHRKARRKYFFAIVDKHSKKYIGSIGFEMISPEITNGVGELGYFLEKRYWRKGIAIEAAKAVIDYAFSVVRLNKIVVNCMKTNHASLKLIEKLKFLKETESPKPIRHENKMVAFVAYGMLNKEWKKKYIPKTQF